MQRINDWENVSEAGGEFDRLEAGGYVCEITKVENFEDKEYLRVELDIIEGKYKNYSADTLERAGFNPTSFIRSYKSSAAGFFKQFISSIEKSNPGYKWNWDENSLAGKKIGAVVAEEEYEKKNGHTGIRYDIAKVMEVAKIRSGDYTVPPRKTLNKPAPAQSSYIADDDLPI